MEPIFRSFQVSRFPGCTVLMSLAHTDGLPAVYRFSACGGLKTFGMNFSESLRMGHNVSSSEHGLRKVQVLEKLTMSAGNKAQPQPWKA